MTSMLTGVLSRSSSAVSPSIKARRAGHSLHDAFDVAEDRTGLLPIRRYDDDGGTLPHSRCGA